MPFKTADAPEIESQRAYVVYDSQTGVIVHAHQVTTFRGASSGSGDEEAARALELAKQFGHRADGSGRTRLTMIPAADNSPDW